MAYRPPFAYIDKYDDFEVEIFIKYIKVESAAVICLILTHIERTDIMTDLFDSMDEDSIKVAEIAAKMLNVSDASKHIVRIVNKTVKEQMTNRLKNAYRLNTRGNRKKVLASISAMNKTTLRPVLDELESVDKSVFREIVQVVGEHHPEKLI